MAEQDMHRRPSSLRISRSPFERDQAALPSSSPNPYVAEYDMHAGDHGLSTMDFNTRRPRASRNLISPDQSLPPVNPRSVVAPSLVHQPFESGPTRNPASVRPPSCVVLPTSYQPKHTYVSAYPSEPLASSNLYEAEPYRSYHQTQPQTQMHAAEVAYDNQSSSHGLPSQHAGAPTNTNLLNSELPANETGGLLFLSYGQARAERDRLFRKPLDNTDGDDVEEVEQNKSKHVLAIKKALNLKDFLPPPKSKSSMKKGADEISEDDKAKWVKWQKNSQQDFETYLSKPKFAAAPEWSETEFRAWEVVTEIIKIHRQGFEVTKQKTDETLKCSARIAEAIRVIEGHSRIRHKILVGDKIPIFCISPQAYVEVTIAACWNNSGRPHGIKNSVSDAVPSQQAGEKDGSVARGPSKGRKKKENKKSAKTTSNGPVGTESSAEQQQTGAVSSGNIFNGFLPVNAEGGEEDEDDAIAGQPSNNAAFTFNRTDYDEGVFDGVPGIPFLHDNDAYPDPFDNIPASMPFFRPQTQRNSRGSGTSATVGMRAQPSPTSTASYPTFSATDFESNVAMAASRAQNNIMYPPYGLPTTVSHHESITDSNLTGRPSAGLQNTQGSQSGVRETPTHKRRRL